MIVKLVKAGGICRHIQADDVLQQPTESGRMDIEVSRHDAPSMRFLIGEDGPPVDVITADRIWHRAYLMENGKTVDTIRPMPAIPWTGSPSP